MAIPDRTDPGLERFDELSSAVFKRELSRCPLRILDSPSRLYCAMIYGVAHVIIKLKNAQDFVSLI